MMMSTESGAKDDQRESFVNDSCCLLSMNAQSYKPFQEYASTTYRSPPMHGTGGGEEEGAAAYGTFSNPLTDQTKHDALMGGHHDATGVFVYSEGITDDEANRLRATYGYNQLPESTTPKWYIFVSLLFQPMPIMIWIAAIIEAAISNYLDMGILFFILFGNATISFIETINAADAVAELKKSVKPEAHCFRNGKWVKIEATLLVPGDLVKLCAGGAIPADCRVNEGTIDVDQAALTGESLPVKKIRGSPVMMGSVVAGGETEGTVEHIGINTFLGTTAALLSRDHESSNLQNILIDIMIVLVVLSLTLCSIVFIYLVQTTDVIDALSFVVVLMVASIPLAIEIVTTSTLALGSRELTKHGAIVTRLSAIEDMAGMAILCSDKTGTLTLNQMMIQKETPVYKQGESQYSILRYAAMATKWDEPAKDALDTMVLGGGSIPAAVDLESMKSVEQLDFMPFDPIGKRTEGTVREKGKTFKTSKGAPHVILGLVNNPEITEKVEHDVRRFGERGIRTLAVAKTNDAGVWEMLGLLSFLDPPRPDTLQTIRDSKGYGVMVKMITGDNILIAKETARRLEMGDNILGPEGLPLLDADKKKPKNLSKNYGNLILGSDGFAQVFPEHKYLIVECLREMGYKVGMTGDGVNDAPALDRADIGVAVCGSTDAAKAAADIVLTEPGLSTIVHGILIARCIFVRIRSFITYRIAATLQLLLFFFIAVFAFKPVDYQETDDGNGDWPDYFHMPVLMLMLITLLNDISLITIAYDYVAPSAEPQRWNLRVLFFIGLILGLVACFSSLILLYILLTAGDISYGQVTTGIYLSVSLTDFLSIFTARTEGEFFWHSMPSPVLMAAALTSMTLSTILAITWPSSSPDGVYTLGMAYHTPYALPVYIWLYCIVWFFVQDAAKVMAYAWLRKYNIFDINNSGRVNLDKVTDAINIERLGLLTDCGV